MIEKIRDDLKEALKAGNKQIVSVLRGLIAAIKNAEIAKRSTLDQQEIITVLQKESKKRTEAANLYEKAGVQERRDAELEEKVIIDNYLPQQLNDIELNKLVDEAIAELQPSGLADMGKVIGRVKDVAGSKADGSRIAVIVKASLDNK